jgi:hypothetical protein
VIKCTPKVAEHGLVRRDEFGKVEALFIRPENEPVRPSAKRRPDAELEGQREGLTGLGRSYLLM